MHFINQYKSVRGANDQEVPQGQPSPADRASGQVENPAEGRPADFFIKTRPRQPDPKTFGLHILRLLALRNPKKPGAGLRKPLSAARGKEAGCQSGIAGEFSEMVGRARAGFLENRKNYSPDPVAQKGFI